MKKASVLLSAILTTVIFVLVACGGKSVTVGPVTITPTTTKASQHMAQSATPVFAINPKSSISTMAMALFQVGQPDVPLTGSFSGFCSALPDGSRWGRTETVLYGLGRWSDSDCGTTWFTASTEGAPVVGDGTLKNLYAFAKGGVSPNGGIVKVYVNGAETSITCTLASGTRCFDTSHSVTVRDNDNVVVTVISENTDAYKNVRVVLGKQ